ncbi:hypothetical protein B0J12DRAFT_579475, partial [Macrophomina phaseolina]
ARTTRSKALSTAKKTTARKATTTKTATAPKEKAAPKPKELTDLQKERLEKRKEHAAQLKAKQALIDLKEKALNEPKLQLATVFSIMLAEAAKKEFEGKKGVQPNLGTIAKVVSQRYKNLSASEHKHYNRLANEAKAANEQTYKKWVKSYSPAEIKAANNARWLLRTKMPGYNKPQIQDERLVKQPATSYILFYKDRYASGAYDDVSFNELGKLASQEWKALNHSEKKKYNDAAEADKQRYVREYQSVYGEKPGYLQQGASA